MEAVIKIKQGVRVLGIQPELNLAISILAVIFTSRGVHFIVTEITGGEHMSGSKHYKGFAADIRSKHIDEGLKVSILKQGQECLGSNYDFILEGKGNPNEHFHIEFDSKE